MAADARIRRLRCLRWSFAVLVGAVVPFVSQVEGSGALAYAMYAHAESWKVAVVAYDRDGGEAGGRSRMIAPSSLAAEAGSDALTLLAGADHWRIGAPVHLLRAHLDDVARFACERVPAGRIDVTLEEREGSYGEARSTSVTRRCD